MQDMHITLKQENEIDRRKRLYDDYVFLKFRYSNLSVECLEQMLDKQTREGIFTRVPIAINIQVKDASGEIEYENISDETQRRLVKLLDEMDIAYEFRTGMFINDISMYLRNINHANRTLRKLENQQI